MKSLKAKGVDEVQRLLERLGIMLEEAKQLSEKHHRTALKIILGSHKGHGDQ